MKDYYTRSTGLIGYADFIKNHGGDILPLLEEVGLDPGLLHQDDGYYSYNKGVMFLDLASRTLNEPNFGLKFARTLAPDFANFGPVAYLGFFEKNARGWIRALLRYQTYHTNGQIIELIERPEKKEGIIRVHTHAYMIASRQLIEMQMASFRMLARQVLNIPEANPRITRFQHEQPCDDSLHREIFGGEVEFGCEYDEFVFDQELLNVRLGGAGFFLKPVVGMYMRYRMRNQPDFDMSVKATVELMLVSIMGSDRCNLDSVAEALSLSPQKMQRMLEGEGTSFSQVLDQVRRKRALQMLRQPAMQIKTIAGFLGYSATPAFTLAFNRWTGMSPSEYRIELQKNNEMLEL